MSGARRGLFAVLILFTVYRRPWPDPFKMRDASFSVYLRDNQVLVVPGSWGVDIDPVTIVEPVETAVQRAIDRSSSFSRSACFTSGTVTDQGGAEER